MESFGRYLRAEREAREVSIEDLSRVTKINRQILQSIEADEFEKLPPPVFVRGFVRTISKTLGLAPEEFVRRYDDYVATHGPLTASAAASAHAAAPVQQTDAPRQSFGRLAFFAGVALLVVALVFGYRLASKGGKAAPKPAAKEEKSGPAVQPANAPVVGGQPVEPGDGAIAGGESPSPVPAPPAQTLPASVPPKGAPDATVEPAAAAEAAPGSHTVVLRAKGACWVQLTSDAGQPKEYILQLNETVSQQYEKTLTVRAGNPVNLSFDWEGKHYEVLATQARPMRWDFPLSAQALQKLDELNNPASAGPAAAPAKPAPKPVVPAAPKPPAPVPPAAAPPAGAAAPASSSLPAPAAASKPPVAAPPTGAPAVKPPAPAAPNASGAGAPESAGGAR